jgi:hypothetical protein
MIRFERKLCLLVMSMGFLKSYIFLSFKDDHIWANNSKAQ